MKEEIFSRIEENDVKLKEFVNLYEKLGKFFTDFDFLKEKNKLTQEEIAKKAGTTQSSVSRIETFRTNPSYKMLQKLASAAGGDLYITPMADMTITVPYDLQDTVRNLACTKETSTQELLLDILRKEIKQYTIVSSKILTQDSAVSSDYEDSVKDETDFIAA